MFHLKELLQQMLEDESFAQEVEEFVNWVITDIALDLMYYGIPGLGCLFLLGAALAP